MKLIQMFTHCLTVIINRIWSVSWVNLCPVFSLAGILTMAQLPHIDLQSANKLPCDLPAYTPYVMRRVTARVNWLDLTCVKLDHASKTMNEIKEMEVGDGRERVGKKQLVTFSLIPANLSGFGADSIWTSGWWRRPSCSIWQHTRIDAH